MEKRFHGRRRSCSAQSERWAEREGRGEAEGVRGKEENAVSTFNSCNNTNHNERINAAEDMGVETRARGGEGTEASLTFFPFRFRFEAVFFSTSLEPLLDRFSFEASTRSPASPIRSPRLSLSLLPRPPWPTLNSESTSTGSPASASEGPGASRATAHRVPSITSSSGASTRSSSRR